MSAYAEFLGETSAFWMELKKRLGEGGDSVERVSMLRELVALQGKLAFYESRIRQMASVMTATTNEARKP